MDSRSTYARQRATKKPRAIRAASDHQVVQASPVLRGLSVAAPKLSAHPNRYLRGMPVPPATVCPNAHVSYHLTPQTFDIGSGSTDCRPTVHRLPQNVPHGRLSVRSCRKRQTRTQARARQTTAREVKTLAIRHSGSTKQHAHRLLRLPPPPQSAVDCDYLRQHTCGRKSVPPSRGELETNPRAALEFSRESRNKLATQSGRKSAPLTSEKGR